jgi:hypothetical protein
LSEANRPFLPSERLFSLESPRRQSHETRRLSREATSRHTYVPRRPVGSISPRGASRPDCVNRRFQCADPRLPRVRNRSRLQIGTMAGFKLERVAGFNLEWMAVFYPHSQPAHSGWVFLATSVPDRSEEYSWRTAGTGRHGRADPHAAEAALAAWGVGSVGLPCLPLFLRETHALPSVINTG